MGKDNITLGQPGGKLILDDFGSELGQVINDALALRDRFPEIELKIFHDQEAHGEHKKQERVQFQEWKKARTPPFDGWEPPEAAETAPPLRLERTGCPRMSPDMVYVFSVLRGYLNSMNGRDAVDRIRDSRAVETYLAQIGQQRPAFRTILDNINTVSQQTLNYILDCQLKVALEENLDDFDEQTLDSTSVEANSEWPTDAAVIYKLLERACRLSGKLHVVSLPCFTDKWVLNHWLPEMKRLLLKVNTVSGKPGSKRKRKKYYNQLLKRAMKSLERLVPYAATLKGAVDRGLRNLISCLASPYHL